MNDGQTNRTKTFSVQKQTMMFTSAEARWKFWKSWKTSVQQKNKKKKNRLGMSPPALLAQQLPQDLMWLVLSSCSANVSQNQTLSLKLSGFVSVSQYSQPNVTMKIIFLWESFAQKVLKAQKANQGKKQYIIILISIIYSCNSSGIMYKLFV